MHCLTSIGSSFIWSGFSPMNVLASMFIWVFSLLSMSRLFMLARSFSSLCLSFRYCLTSGRTMILLNAFIVLLYVREGLNFSIAWALLFPLFRYSSTNLE